MAAEIAIGRVDTFREGSVVAAEAGDRKIAVINVEGRLHAIDDCCPHDECLFSEYGEVAGDKLVCTCHMSSFDLRTGKAISGPAYGDATMHRLVIRDGEVFMDLPGDA